MSSDFETVKQFVIQRVTQKVIAEVENPIIYSPDVRREWDAVVEKCIAAAGMAPFHFERGVDGVPEPWRVHFLETDTCRLLANNVSRWFEIKPANKIPGMLSACGCLLLVNWLPQFRSRSQGDDTLTGEKKIEIDDEHLAATAAMVQNLLILLTAAGLGTYWSSGGFLGSQEIFGRLGIQDNEKLLAAVFVEYPAGQGTAAERIPGKNRKIRCSAERWSFMGKLNVGEANV